MTDKDDKDLQILENQLLQEVIVKARDNFLTFVRLMAPQVLPERFVDGRHIEIICQRLEDVCRSVEDKSRDPKKLQIMLPPGSMKSKIASNLFPAWCLGRHPNWCFLAIGSDLEFAIDNFGRPTKDLIDSAPYRQVFPQTVLRRNVKSAGRWDTTRKGRFVAKGAGQNIAGRRAHIAICDDVITEQTTDQGRKDINSWYRKGLRTRLLPRGAEVIINTRWFVEDLSGFMMKVDDAVDQPWEVVKIPAILTLEGSRIMREGLDATHLAKIAERLGVASNEVYSEGSSFWPEFWPLKLLQSKKDGSVGSEWAALYMQEPIAEDGAIIKRKDFQLWTKDKPPKCYYTIVSMDTAFGTKETNDYTAVTVWGSFTNQQEVYEGDLINTVAQECMILLGADKGRWDFAELCRKAKEYDALYQPDYFIIEDRASGQSLIPELQKQGLPIVPYKIAKDKSYRLQSCTPYFQAGRVWVPEHTKSGWAEAVVDEVVSFQPRLKNQKDDYTDTVSQVILWMRDRYKIDNEGYSNHWDEEVRYQKRHTYWSATLPKAH